MVLLLRTALLVTSAIALLGCGDTFTPTGSTGASANGSAAGNGGAGTAGSDSAAGPGGDAGASGESGASGSAGSEPCDSSDHDNDGHSECAGDCDDDDGSVFPGALEVCGDGVDGNCDDKSDDDPPCNGIGTFVSQTKGVIGGKGTTGEPVATIEEGVARAEQIGVPTTVFVAEGVYAEEVTLKGGVSLAGGYSASDWKARDPEAHKTTLKSKSPKGLQIVGAIEGVVVDGFVLEGPAVGAGNDSIAVLIDGGSPALTNNSIKAGSVLAGSGSSVGVRVVSVNAPAGAVTLYGNGIAGGEGKSRSYGVEVDSEPATVVLVANLIGAAKGENSVALMVERATLVAATLNVLQSGIATGSITPSSSFGAWVRKGSLVFDSNLVNPDQLNSPPSCFTPGAWCGGVRVSTNDAVITNNIINGGVTKLSVGVHLRADKDDLAGVVVSSNLISAGGYGDPASLSATVLLQPPPGKLNASMGRLRNNLLIGGLASNNYGIWEKEDAGASCDPAALDHNLFYFPIDMPKEGVLYRDYNGLTGSDITLLDMLPGDGKNLHEDPKLTSDGHLALDSPCRNAGTAQDAPSKDFEQQGRPQENAFDIGPDELSP